MYKSNSVTCPMVWKRVQRLMANAWARLGGSRTRSYRSAVNMGGFCVLEPCMPFEVKGHAAEILQSKVRRMLVALRRRETVEALVLGHCDANCILSTLNSDLLVVIMRFCG